MLWGGNDNCFIFPLPKTTDIWISQEAISPLFLLLHTALGKQLNFSIRLAEPLLPLYWESISTRSSLLLKISKYINQHYVIGELHMKFLKDRCSSKTDSRCDSCRRDWIGPVFSGLPEPAPDYSRLPEYHYKSVFDTSMKEDNGTPRDVDDFLPRPNITKRIEEGSLKLEDEESINKFCSEFITDPEYVKKYMEHKTNLKKANQIRDKEKAKYRYERSQKKVTAIINGMNLSNQKTN